MNATNSILMDAINLLWNRPEARLIGINSDNNGSYDELILRDQAVDSDIDGSLIATFDYYRLEFGPADDRGITIDFTAADVLAYIRTHGV